jgi:hypothetical protein
MTQHHSNPERASDSHALPDIETFEAHYCDECGALAAVGIDPEHSTECDESGAPRMIGTGWFWQACFPGCLPDSDPVGPFATEAEALADAREGRGDA